jgi:DNA-directed RNA polymerase subunit RPC12/RpoP
MFFSDETRKKIQDSLNSKLQEKDRKIACPVCGNLKFILADGFTRDSLQDDVNAYLVGGPEIPEIVLVCSHCGHILKFSAGILGISFNKKEVISTSGNESKDV